MFQASEDRQAAFDFLSSLEEYLNRCLPGPAQLVEQIRTIVEESKRTGQTPQTNFPEGAFLNRFIVPHLHEFLAKRLGKEDARAALLSESFKRLPDYASGTPARSKRHPFRDRKSTRLNSSHGYISYAVFCLKKKKQQRRNNIHSNDKPSTQSR